MDHPLRREISSGNRRMLNLSMQFSAAISIAILVTASSSHTRALVDAGTSLADATVLGYRFAYLVALVGLIAGVTLAAVLLRKPSSPRTKFERTFE